MSLLFQRQQRACPLNQAHLALYQHGLNQVLNLTTGWNLFDLTFTTSGFSGSSSDIRLQFWLSPYDAAGDVYWFDAIELTQAGSANVQTSRYGLAKALPAPRTQPSGTVRKYYYAGSTRVAMRENATLYWLLSDHLGGTSITVSNTTETGKVRYYPWGNDRYTSGTTRTSFKFTGQRRESGIGLPRVETRG